MFKKNTPIGFNVDWDKIPDDNITKRNLKFVYDNMSDTSRSMSCVINGVPIVFDKRNKDISITLSGGADSTMLLFLLCKIIENFNLKIRVHCITLLRFTEDRLYLERVVEDVILYIKQRFPDIEILQHTGFVPTALELIPLSDLKTGLERLGIMHDFEEVIKRGATADVYAVNSYSNYVTTRYKIGWIYDGTTTNPDDLAVSDSTQEPTTQGPVFRNSRELTLTDVRGSLDLHSNYSKTQTPLTDKIRSSPFEFIQKNWVMAQYKNFGIEDLLELTRSCEGSATILDDTFGKGLWTTRGSDYVCNNCFFCSERQWGIDKNSMFLRENCQSK
jgi:hypothetical protein